MNVVTILAQEGAPAGGGGLGMFIPMILIMVMFYFVLIRPQRKQQKQLEEMRKGLGNGDKVVTIGGIHGIVTGASSETVSIKVADGLSLKFDRSAIASVTAGKNHGADDDIEDSEEEKDS